MLDRMHQNKQFIKFHTVIPPVTNFQLLIAAQYVNVRLQREVAVRGATDITRSNNTSPLIAHRTVSSAISSLPSSGSSHIYHGRRREGSWAGAVRRAVFCNLREAGKHHPTPVVGEAGHCHSDGLRSFRAERAGCRGGVCARRPPRAAPSGGGGGGSRLQRTSGGH